jgi:hypothetical protein
MSFGSNVILDTSDLEKYLHSLSSNEQKLVYEEIPRILEKTVREASKYSRSICPKKKYGLVRDGFPFAGLVDKSTAMWTVNAHKVGYDFNYGAFVEQSDFGAGPNATRRTDKHTPNFTRPWFIKDAVGASSIQVVKDLSVQSMRMFLKNK